jgi:outer membrane protein assembly factor BamA
MSSAREKTLLKEGLPYNLDLIKGERDRIDKILTEKGYFYFRPDYIIVQADSSVGDHQVDLFVRLKYEEVPAEAYDVYKINNVFIYPNYRLRGEHRDTSLENATLHEGYFVVDKDKTFRPIVFEQAMQFEPEELYNRTEQNMSLNRLVSLGTFKFVKNRFDPIFTREPRLDVYYYLTPYPKKAIRFEVGVESQSDSRVGSHASLSWRHRNAFRGAELLTVALRGGYEAQAGGNVDRPPIFEGGVDVRLAVPRFWIPFVKVTPSSMFIPRTTTRLSYDVTMRQELYLIHSIKGSYGYEFRENIRKEHKLYPININYVKTDTLDVNGQLGIDYSNLIFNGLIIGPTYEYTFNSQASGLKADNYYFNGLIDFSNNILGLVQGASQTQPKKIFGTTYAQYMKYQADGRYYRNYSAHKNDVWANRIIVGFGYPYGNSRQLPNIKQFFSGGSSSLRGFPSRSVGPGRFNEKYLYGDAQRPRFVETLGDIKLELNTEIRKHIYQFVNAAVFIDAGNIWTYYDDPRFPGGKFTSKFLEELAVDAGVGLRLDFNILLLRLDLAVPIRKPWLLPVSDRWVFSQVDFADSGWRNQNMIFNLAIGYPF